MGEEYSYEIIEPDSEGNRHFRIRDSADNRIATCYLEENAKFIVDRLNGKMVDLHFAKLEGLEAAKKLVCTFCEIGDPIKNGRHFDDYYGEMDCQAAAIQSLIDKEKDGG